MLHTRSLSLVLTVFVAVAIVSQAPAQDAAADKANVLLRQGISQFDAMNYRAAKATLLQVDASALAAADKKTLNDHLSKVDTAIRKQAGAMEALRNAEKALKANDLATAESGFAAAAASPYLPPQTRKDAKAQLALVKKRAEMAAAADKAATDKAAADAAAKVAATAAADKAAADKATADAAAMAAAKAAADKAAADKAAADAAAKVAAADKTSAPKLSAPTPKTPAKTPEVDNKVKAQSLLAAGKAALDKQQNETALQYFQKARALDPDNDEIRKQLNFARGLVGTTAEAGPIGRLERIRRIRRQEANVEYDKNMKRSLEALTGADAEADFDNAEAAVRLAENVVETNKGLYPESEYRQKRTEMENQLRFVQTNRVTWQKKLVQIQRIDMKDAEAERIAKEQEQRKHRIAVLTARARTLTAEHKYEEAREELQRIVALDPGNPWAIEQKEMLDQFVILLSERDIHKAMLGEEQKSLVAIREAQIPWYKELMYPRDWKELSIRRAASGAASFSESEADRAVRAKLKTRLQKLDFDNIEFSDVIQFLRDVSGLSIYVKWQALSAAGVEKATTVTIHLGNVTVEKALRVILDDVGGVNPLGFIVEEGVVTITSNEDLQSRTITRVYDIRDMIVRVPNFKGPRMELDVQAGQGSSSGGGGGGGGGGLFEEEATADDEMTKEQIIEQIKSAITETIAPDSWADSTRVGIRELHGQFIITQTADNHRAILELVGQLREARALQVSIECRFIQVTTGFLNRVGVDMDFYFNMGSRLGTGGAGAGFTDPWTGGTISPGTSAGFPSTSDSFTPISIAQDGASWLSTLATGQAGDIGASGTSAVPTALSIAGSFLDDIQVNFLIEATQASQTSRLLTAPRLTLFNGQRAYIAVAQVFAYIANYEPVVGENSAALRPIVGYIPTGSVLDVEATVSADRRYVTLTLRPQLAARIGAPRQLSFFVAGGGNLTSATIELPEVSIQDIQTTVSVPDGGTLLLGGQKVAGELEKEIGAPLISKIPILNRAFTNRGKTRDERTILILVKPKIIIQKEEEELAFP